MKYLTRITELTVVPEGRPIISESATKLRIEDEGGGEFLVISQNRDDENKDLRFDKDEWPHIVKAAKTLLDGMVEGDK